MASPSIDDGTTDTPFLNFSRQPLPAGEQLKSITRAGVDGHAFRKIGSQSRPFQMLSVVDVDTLANVEIEVDLYKAYVGKLVTITDDLDNERENVVVLDVEIVQAVAVATFVGGINAPSAAMVTARWLLQMTT